MRADDPTARQRAAGPCNDVGDADLRAEAARWLTMSWQKTGNRVHDDTCIAAESVHQVSVAGAAISPSGQAAVRQADRKFLTFGFGEL